MNLKALLFALTIGSMLSSLSGASETDSAPYTKMSVHYEAIRLALVEDSMEGLAGHAEALAEAASDLLERTELQEVGQVDALGDIRESASRLAEASEIDTARERLFLLTKPLAKYRKLTGDETAVVVYCSMAQKAWIQPEGDIGNPYMGQRMPRCGEVVGE